MPINSVQHGAGHAVHQGHRRHRVVRGLRRLGMTVGVVAAVGGVAVLAMTPAAPPGRPVGASAPPVRAGLGGVEVTALQVGTIQIRRCHELPCLPPQWPLPVRLLRILADDTRTTPLPILTGAVAVDGRVIAVDTGELADFEAARDGEGACDPVGEAIDHAIGVLQIAPDQELKPQLERLGLWPVSAIALTHLHFDHTGGVPALVDGRPDLPVHLAGLDHGLGPRAGAVTCKSLRAGTMHFFEDRRRDHGDEIDTVFGPTVDLAPRVRVLALPGHTPRSLGVLVDGDDLDVLFIGDIAFRERDLDDERMNGIHHDAADVVRSMAAVRRWAASHPTIVVPAHDEDALSRLAARTVYIPRGQVESP